MYGKDALIGAESPVDCPGNEQASGQQNAALSIFLLQKRPIPRRQDNVRPREHRCPSLGPLVGLIVLK